MYELLFERVPVKTLYNDEDKAVYKTILEATNAHKRNYQPEERINSNRCKKYTDVISKLFGKQVGGGLYIGAAINMVATDSPIDYVHWNEPNEMVGRLRLLVAPQNAGHTGHNNEIASIIEELLEAGLIM